MSPTTAISVNLPPRPTPSSIVEAIQRSPVLSPRIADPRQQRSGSLRPSSPPQRPATPPLPPVEQKSENGITKSGTIDMEIFQQILDLDDDGSYDFAWEMVREYLAQAEKTFLDMDDAIKKKDCKQLSELGHFLKGSSATLGVTGVRDTCESIQHYGGLRDSRTGKVIAAEAALSKIAAALEEARRQYKAAEEWLKVWYQEGVTDGRIQPTDEDD